MSRPHFIKSGWLIDGSCGPVQKDMLLKVKNGSFTDFIVARATPVMLPGKLSSLEGIYINGIPCSRKFFKKILTENRNEYV